MNKKGENGSGWWIIIIIGIIGFFLFQGKLPFMSVVTPDTIATQYGGKGSSYLMSCEGIRGQGSIKIFGFNDVAPDYLSCYGGYGVDTGSYGGAEGDVLYEIVTGQDGADKFDRTVMRRCYGQQIPPCEKTPETIVNNRWKITSSYQLIPITNTQINIVTHDYFQGSTENIIEVEVINNWISSLNVNLIAWLEVKDPFYQTSSYLDISQTNKILNKGSNKFYFTIPSTLTFGEYNFHIELVALYSQDNIANSCFNHWDGRCVFIEGGKFNCHTESIYSRTDCNTANAIINSKGSYVTTEKFNLGSKDQNFLINTKPIYVYTGCPNTPCPSDYTCQTESGLCLRTDVIEKRLGCQELGCPVLPDHTYSCTSAGICAETIYQFVGCPTQTCPTGTICDNTSGTCILEKIYRELFQCDTSSDCMAVCAGKTASCVSNKCIYSGDCLITTVDCHTIGCAEGYTCSGSPGVCQRTEFVNQQCPTLTCPPEFTCSTEEGVCINRSYYQAKDCRDLGCSSGFECNKNTGLCQQIIYINATTNQTISIPSTPSKPFNMWIWILVGIGAIGTAIYFATKK